MTHDDNVNTKYELVEYIFTISKSTREEYQKGKDQFFFFKFKNIIREY